MKRNANKSFVGSIQALALLMLTLFPLSSYSAIPELSATTEVVWLGTDIPSLSLNSPAAIYEFVRNNYRYYPYHGARSNSENTLGAKGANDIDLASLLIAIYRAKGIPARYATAIVKIPESTAANWLNVTNNDIAYNVLLNNGIASTNGGLPIQGVKRAAGQFELEHTWVQVKVPYNEYRGSFFSTTSCATANSPCHWVDVDPSFKQNVQTGGFLDIIDQVPFDYNRYFTAAANDDADYRDKNPLSIYENLITKYLNQNYPGKTLDDVAVKFDIIQDHAGILPASLPFQVAGPIRTFNSVAERDSIILAENGGQAASTWSMKVDVELHYGGKTVNLGKFPIAKFSTEIFPIYFRYHADGTTVFNLHVGDKIYNPQTLSPSITMIKNQPFGLKFKVDQLADPTACPNNIQGPCQIIDYVDKGLKVGDYAVFNASHHYANAGQVQRAVNDLKYLISTTPIYEDANGVVRIDELNDGQDSSDPEIYDTAFGRNYILDFMNVAIRHYMNKGEQGGEKLCALMHTVCSVLYAGIVSARSEALYFGDTLFGISPKGLLIDLPGVTIITPLRYDGRDGIVTDGNSIRINGYYGSALEHEVWQDIASLDAISSVRGMQRATADGSVIYSIDRNNKPTAALNAIKTSYGTSFYNAMLADINSRYSRYLIPSNITHGDLQSFNSYVIEIFSDSEYQNFSRGTFAINIAHGGYVDSSFSFDSFTPIIDNTGYTPNYNNSLFTNVSNVSQVNNDLIRTPSTIDPVSTVTGNMYHDETDFTIKGRGLPYTFSRTYNSNSPDTLGPRPFSKGWTHSYNLFLRSNDFGECPNCAPGTGAGQKPENGNNKTSSISFFDERGGEHTYLLNADSSTTRAVAKNPQGEFNTLLLNYGGNTQQWALEFRNGARYVFTTPANFATVPNQIAKIAYIEDAYTNRLTMTYDPATGLLSNVKDNLNLLGRSGLTFHYSTTPPNGRRALVKVSDWAGREWNYYYNNKGEFYQTDAPGTGTGGSQYDYHGEGLLKVIRKTGAQRPGYPGGASTLHNEMTFHYFDNDRALSYINKLGEEESLFYDLFRQRTTVTSPRGFDTEYEYDTDTGALETLRQRDGAYLRFENTSDGLRSSKTNGLGYKTSYSYQLNRSISEGPTDAYGLITREVDALDNQTDYSYNFNLYDQITITTDKRGHAVTRNYYTATNSSTGAVKGKLQEVRATINGQSNVLLQSYTYYSNSTDPAFGQLKQKINYIDPAQPSRKRTSDYVYYPNGIDLQTVTVSGATTAGAGTITVNYTYDNLGRTLTQTLTRHTSATDSTAIPIVTTYTHDALDRIVTVTNSIGNITETVFDGNGKVQTQQVRYLTSDFRSSCLTSGNYKVCPYARYGYDAFDRATTKTDILNNKTQFSYDKAGNVETVTDPFGHVTRYEYDAMDRRTAVIDANGHRTEMKYDLAGNLKQTTDANGNTTAYEYDALNRLKTATTELGRETRFDYDVNGNMTCMIDANADAGSQPMNSHGCSEYREYDEFNRLTRIVDASNAITRYTYDLLGNITKITDAEGQETVFVYDDLGRLTKSIDPLIESGTDKVDEILQYDEAGNILLSRDRSGRQRRHTYDRLNRLTRTEYLSDNTQDVWVYDDFGDLVTTSNADVTYAYTYTSRHEVKTKTDSRLNRSMGWTYDAVGNLKTKTNYQGDVTTYLYDNTNRLVGETSPAFLHVSYHYDGAGRLKDRILSNGVRTNYDYDNDNRLTDLDNYTANGTLVSGLHYTHDEVGNIKQISDSVSGRTVNYGYDPLYRLLTVDSTLNSEDRSYTYDLVGNRKTEVRSGTTYHYCYHATDCTQKPKGNRLYSIRTGSPSGSVYRTFTYDDSGRVITKRNGANQMLYILSYNGKGEAKSVYDPTIGAGIPNQFDTAGYRIGKGSNLYHLEGEHLESIFSGNGTLLNKYLRGVVIDEVVNGYTYHSANTNDWTNYTFHHDQVNSVVALTGHDGATEETTKFDAFGAPLNLNIATGNNLLFTGRELDRGTGLYYYRARFYDAEIGRFVQEDPIGFSGGINKFAYVGNNPINANDPMGLAARKALETIAGQFGWGECKECANALVDAARNQGLSGTRIDVRAPGAGNIWSDINGRNISTNGDHSAVEIDGLVYDNINHGGVPRAQWEGALATPITPANPNGSLSFVETAFGGSIGYSQAIKAVSVAGAGVATWLGDPKTALADTAQFAFDWSPLADIWDAVKIDPVGDGSALWGPGSSFATFDAFQQSQGFGNSASGGFVNYPSMPNTNMMQSAYRK